MIRNVAQYRNNRGHPNMIYFTINKYYVLTIKVRKSPDISQMQSLGALV